jgi:ubiquinone/menaquinone biosynthesis C-methylase UbiE
MSFHDAIVIPRALQSDGQDYLLPLLTAETTVGEVISRAVGVPEEQVISDLLRYEEQGYISVLLISEDEQLNEVYEHLARIEEATAEDPGLHNVVAYEREWNFYPELFDFVDGDSELALLKGFERDIYWEHLNPYLDTLPHGAKLLDAGCGVGRFSVDLARRGFDLTLVDSSARALKRAMAHCLDAGASVAKLHSYLGDVRHLPGFADNSFDCTLSIEVICYQTDPAESLAELVRVTKPGGLVIVSVEGKYGSLIFDRKIDLDHAQQVLEQDMLLLEDDVFVRYFTSENLRRLIASAGLNCVQLIGTHYLPEGVLSRLVDDNPLDNEKVREQVLALEHKCAADPVLGELARAWVAVCRKE